MALYPSFQLFSGEKKWGDWSVAGLPEATVPLLTLPMTAYAVTGTPGGEEDGELAWLVGAWCCWQGGGCSLSLLHQATYLQQLHSSLVNPVHHA